MSGISAFPTGVGRLGPGCPPTQRIGLPFCLSFNSTPPSYLPLSPLQLEMMMMMCKAVRVAVSSRRAAGPQHMCLERARGRATSPQPFLQPMQEP